jgi:hypothetical protein
MVTNRRLLDIGTAYIYGRAVLAIARADEELGLEEGLRIVRLIEDRTGQPVSLDDLLLEDPLDPGELVASIRATSGPFRGAGVHPGELAAMIVLDAIAVVLAKGYVADAEARELLRFAVALGCTVEEVREMSAHLLPFFGGLFEPL